MIVNFYKNNKKMYSCYANGIEDVKGNPTAYYSEFDKDTYITEIEFKNPVSDNGRLREATKDELVAQGVEVDLNEGEVIQDKKIKVLEKPSKWHKWINGEWVVDLDEVKRIKRNEFKEIRHKKVNENIVVHGAEFQVREQDLENFNDAERAITLKVKSLTDTINWILADNTVKEFTYEHILKVLIARGTRKQEIFKDYVKLNYMLIKATSVAEIDNIKWVAV